MSRNESTINTINILSDFRNTLHMAIAPQLAYLKREVILRNPKLA